MNLFLKNKRDKRIFKVDYICMCDECKKRGMPELFINDLNGNYVDTIKVSELFNSKWELSNDFNELLPGGSNDQKL